VGNTKGNDRTASRFRFVHFGVMPQRLDAGGRETLDDRGVHDGFAAMHEGLASVFLRQGFSLSEHRLGQYFGTKLSTRSGALHTWPTFTPPLTWIGTGR